MKKILILGMALVANALPATADVVQTFDDPVVIGNSQAPGVWYRDRYAPNGFASVDFNGENVLQHSIVASDVQAGAFQNTQGRKYDVNTTYMSIDLYIPEDLDDTFGSSRYAGFWGTAVSGPLDNSPTYPIIEYRRAGGGYSPVGDLGFSVYDGNTGLFIDYVTAQPLSGWYTLELEMVGDDVTMSVDGIFSHTITYTNSNAYFTNAILQGYNASPGYDFAANTPGNTGATYNILWDNFVTEAPVVPIPAAAPLGLLGMGLIAFMRRRKKQA